MNAVIEVVAGKMNLPYWWVEAIALEYLECREYAAHNEIWKFNFDKLSQSEIEKAVRSHKVVVNGTLMHNVLADVWASRAIERLCSDISVRLVEEIDDVIAEGLVSKSHFPFIGNSIDVWDPKLDFSNCFQVLDGDKFWQWRIAEFVQVAGRNYGKWVSSDVDLEPLDQIHERLASLRNHAIKPSEPGYDEFKIKVEEFYRWLDALRRPILSALENIHFKKRLAQKSFLKVIKSEPPKLSRFEMFTVHDGEILTKFFAEPVFFRGCLQHANKARELASSVKNDRELVSKLDEIYQERAIAIILGTACLEAFINGLGYEHFKDWEKFEKKSLIAKWKLFLKLKSKGNLFDPYLEPYKSLNQLIISRNYLIHFKRQYEKAHLINNESITLLEMNLPEDFVHNLPEKLEQLIKELCNVTDLTIPTWLTPKTDWLL